MSADAYFLQTKRLGFRLWRDADLEAAVALWGDPEVSRYLFAKGPPDRAAIEARLSRELSTQAQHGLQYWPMFLLEGGALVGCCGLRPYRLDEKIFEFGVHLLPAFWRQGLAMEAAAAVIEFGFTALSARALFAGHHPANVASRQMLARLGFRYTHDELYPPTGLYHPSYLLEKDTCTTTPQVE